MVMGTCWHLFVGSLLLSCAVGSHVCTGDRCRCMIGLWGRDDKE